MCRARGSEVFFPVLLPTFSKTPANEMLRLFDETDRLFSLLPAGVRGATLRGADAWTGRARDALIRFRDLRQALVGIWGRLTEAFARRENCVREARIPVRIELTAHIPAEVQWARVGDVLISAGHGAEAVGRLHSSAGEQLEAAAYGLRSMLDELQAVMTMARSSGEPLAFRLERPRVARRVGARRAMAA
jgi:hypothetical protein